MSDLKIWKFLLDKIQMQQPVILMVVLESIGSSPGRRGFKMAVTQTEILGSVGGGIMEHKFVEMAKGHLAQQLEGVSVKQQIHSKNSPKNQSGMICSGEQTIALFSVNSHDEGLIKEIIELYEENREAVLTFDLNGFTLNLEASKDLETFKKEDPNWSYSEKLGNLYHLHIVGGGHVSLAFSKLMADLKFNITVYDDRPDLNTFIHNPYAHQKLVVDYHKIDEAIQEGSQHLIVIMTFGYRTDGVVLRKLLKKKVLYIGLLGSKAKINQMWKELNEEGILSEDLEKVHAPIGMQINSQTPEEIAVSIAAEIIGIKNGILQVI